MTNLNALADRVEEVRGGGREKFSPGPWYAGKLYGDEDDGGPTVSVGPYPLNDVKQHHYEDGIADVHEMNGNDAEANANLIAAAPEMYAVLDAAWPCVSDAKTRGAIAAVLRRARGEGL